MALRVLVTGAAGFVGSHITRTLNDGCDVVALDSLAYAARLENIADTNVKFVCHDFRQPFTPEVVKQIGAVDYVIHNGAESHVARSFQNPRTFVESNVLGTLNVLEFARTQDLKRFIYVSTDEVFGPSLGHAYTESDRLCPTNPYAATKAAGEQLVHAYYRSYGLPTVITRTMNMFGERQHYEKFIPKAIGRILAGKPVTIHQSAMGEIGTRHWLYVAEQVKAISTLMVYGENGQSYNVSCGVVKSNLEIAQQIADILKCRLLCKYETPQEPTHDLHYSIDDSKMRGLRRQIFGCDLYEDFDLRLRDTVLWYRDNPSYLEELSGSAHCIYRKF